MPLAQVLVACLAITNAHALEFTPMDILVVADGASTDKGNLDFAKGFAASLRKLVPPKQADDVRFVRYVFTDSEAGGVFADSPAQIQTLVQYHIEDLKIKVVVSLGSASGVVEAALSSSDVKLPWHVKALQKSCSASAGLASQ